MRDLKVDVFPFIFEKDDLLWEIITRFGIGPKEVRESILAYAYMIAKSKNPDDVSEKIGEAFRVYRRWEFNKKREDMKKAY